MENKGHVPNTDRSAVMIDFIRANFLIIFSKFTSLHIPFSSNAVGDSYITAGLRVPN